MTTLSLPDAACDCHVHVIGPQERYPMTFVRRYTPGPASAAMLQAHLPVPVVFDHFRVAAHRVLWASDWPHTARDPGLSPHEVSPYRPVSSADLLGALYQWLPTPTIREQVLVDNLARLYGF